MAETDDNLHRPLIGDDAGQRMPGDKAVGLNLRALIQLAAARLGAREEIGNLADLEAIRMLQLREGNTPCYGRETALRPGPDGICLVSECLWRNFCSAYRSKAVPLDGTLSPLPEPGDLHRFTEFLLTRGQQTAAASAGLGVTVQSQVELESLSRKLVLGSPHSTICESFTSANALHPVRLNFSAREDGSGHYMHYYRLERTVLWTASAPRLYNWYASAHSLLGASTLDYLPHLSVESERVGVWKTNDLEFTQLATPEFRSLVTPHMAVPMGDVFVSDPNFVPLLNLEIPFLESASLEDIHRIMTDYPDELCSFRDFLFKNVDKIKDKRLESDTFGADLNAIRRELEEQIRKLRSDLKKARVKHYVEITGGVAAAFTLAVFCIVQRDSHTLSILGPGGALYMLSTRVAEYLNARLSLRENPAYFLWMIGPGQRL